MPLDARLSPCPSDSTALRRLGTLVARGWRAKLYAPVLEAGGLRPEDLAAAKHAYRAGIAGPGAAPAAWRRCVLDANVASLDADMAECRA